MNGLSDHAVALRAANFHVCFFPMGAALMGLGLVGAIVGASLLAEEGQPAAGIVLLPLVAVCLNGLRGGLVWSLALFEPGDTGLRGRFLWMTETVAWTEICRMELSEHLYVHLDVGGRHLILRPVKGCRDIESYRLLHRAWRRGVTGSGQRNVPLFLQSLVPPGAWVVVSSVLLIMGTALTASWLRGDAPGWIAAILAAVGVGGILRGWTIRSEKVVLSREGITRTRALTRRFVPWEDVDLLGTGLFQSDPPWHGRARIESRHGVVRFSTRPQWFRPFARYLRHVCSQTFRLDLESGKFLPPQSSDRLLDRQRVTETALRLHRRYMLSGVAQLLLLPLVALGWLGALGAGILFRNCNPVSWGDVASSFRRARQIRQCLEEYQSMEADPLAAGGPASARVPGEKSGVGPDLL